MFLFFGFDFVMSNHGLPDITSLIKYRLSEFIALILQTSPTKLTKRVLK